MVTSTRTSNCPLMAPVVLLVVVGLFLACFEFTAAQSVGVCFGMLGDNLPPSSEVVSLYKSMGIQRMRIYNPDLATLRALKGSNIGLMLGVPNSALEGLATNPSNANSWVQTYVRNFSPGVKFRYIAVGNDVNFSTGSISFLLPAMQNVYNAIASAGLQNQIKVSTTIDMSLVGDPSRPSHGTFRDDVRTDLDPIIAFLVQIKAPLLANIHPYFSYNYSYSSSSPQKISLPYAIFTSPSVVVQDGQRGYQNLFDAMLDTLYAALDRAGGATLDVVVSESGWPSAGGFATTVGNASIYYSNLIRHVNVNRGTPRRPNRAIETYLFSMFDENNSSTPVGKNFGLFFPNKQLKYSLNFAPFNFYLSCDV